MYGLIFSMCELFQAILRALFSCSVRPCPNPKANLVTFCCQEKVRGGRRRVSSNMAGKSLEPM